MKARKIELKTLDVTMPDGTKQPFKYETTIQTIITMAGEGGMSTDDILKAVDIKSELKKSHGVLHLDEATFNWVLGKVNGFRWGMADEAIAEFIKDVRNAPQVELAEAEAT